MASGSGRSVDVALLAAEAARCRLLENRRASRRRSEEGRGNPSARRDAAELERGLRSMCAWATSNFVASAVPFPGDASAEEEVRSHSFPYLVDCLPVMTGPSDEGSMEDECLRRTILRSIHAALSSGLGAASGESPLPPGARASSAIGSTPSGVAPSFVDQFRNRCIAKGYFSHLVELARDPSESIAGPAISIAVVLIGSFSGPRAVERGTRESLVETACSNALRALESSEPGDDGLRSDSRGDSIPLRLGSKRRKLERRQRVAEPLPPNPSIQSAFAHAISDALIAGRNIEARLAEGTTPHIPMSGGPEVVSALSESDVLLLRSVAGCLRILLSLQSQPKLRDSGADLSSNTNEVTSRLFQCVQCVSDVMVRKKSKDDKLLYFEPTLKSSALSSVVSVGLHACRVQNGTEPANHSAAREAISACALAALPTDDDDRCVQPEESASARLATKTNATNRFCGGICSRLALVGGIEMPHSDLCLCRLGSGGHRRISAECGGFTFDEALPLPCRCIFLAMFFPSGSTSEHHEPTLSSIRSVLAGSAKSKVPMVLKAALLGLPNLFISLAARNGGHGAASAKQLTMMIDSFRIEDRVIPHIKSDEEDIKIAALVSLARLARVYSAASLLASGEGGECEGTVDGQMSNASSYLHQLNPTFNGMHSVVLSSLSPYECCAITIPDDKQNEHFHPTFGIPLFSNNGSSLFIESASSGQWMASLIYLQTTVALIPKSLLRSSELLGFFSNKRHYEVIDQLAKQLRADTKNEESVSAQIPPPIWLFMMPFLSKDKTTQSSAVTMFGRTLFCNGCKLFSAFFIPESEGLYERVSNKTARMAADKLFSEMDFLLRFCGLGQELLCAREAHLAPNDGVSITADARIAVGVFSSLCQWSSMSTPISDYIVERSLLALIRIWVGSSGGLESSTTDPTSNSSLASSAFESINEIFQRNGQQRSPLSAVASKCANRIMSKIFMEFFLPPNQDITVSTRYRLLTVFIGTILLPSSATRSIQTHNDFEAASVVDILGFVDRVYPSVILQLIKDEDHEAIQMCTAFRMYLLGMMKLLTKEEKRVHKKRMDEFMIGSRPDSRRSGRSLVPGLQISTSKLVESTKLLCLKTDILKHVLPRLLLHPGRAPLRFFTTQVCQSELNYPSILREIDLPVLKTLVWELGCDDPEEDKEEEMYSKPVHENFTKRSDVRLALTKGFLLKEGESSKMKDLPMSPLKDSLDDEAPCSSAAGRWIAPNFMYLMVNIVLRWTNRSERDKFQMVKCLRAMLQFLPPSDPPQYMPQIMTAINNAISSPVVAGSNLRFIAVATLFDFVKIVSAHDASQVGHNLTIICVALFPLFGDGESRDCGNDLARSHAVQMLEWIASGRADENLPLFFSEVPFLPFTEDLKNVRSLLAKKGVHLDDIRTMSQQAGHEDAAGDVAQLESLFQSRMSILAQLCGHENRDVRRVVVVHMTKLINTNRDLFQTLVMNEELSSMNFLTVVHGLGSKAGSSSPLNATSDDKVKINGGFITKLLIRLLSRCVNETDRGIRDAIATCLGEIGAIDPNRLGKEINSSQIVANSSGCDDSNDWRLANPPWKTDVGVYQWRLVSRHLVSSLKAVPTTLDQHKISFAIQELLKILDAQLGGGGDRSEISPQLKEKLQNSGVSNELLPFWSSNYKQHDTAAPKSPPIFPKSNSYYSWKSSFCRYLIARSHANKRSVWGDFFHACRSAVRSQAGIGVAEFLFPLFILDTVCFGGKTDEDAVLDEFLLVLSFENSESNKGDCLMTLREREKAANAVFTVMGVLRYWMEQEIEQRHHSSKGKSKRKNASKLDEGTSWPAPESVKKIERFLGRIPLSLCAKAASEVGMRARALQFLEVEGRRRVASNGDNYNSTKDNSHFLHGTDLQLTQSLLGQLNDFDTMVFVAQQNCQQTDFPKKLMSEAVEREMYEDWDGALQAYEQLLDSRLNINPDDSSLTESCAQKGLLRCLLKLGRLDSLLNQSYGISTKSGAHESSLQIRDEFLPYAAEASWRLGNWSVLDNLVSELDCESALDPNARYQLSFGRTMNALHSKSREGVISGLRDSRESLMSSLSSAARDGYTRSVPYLEELHALREVECISSIFFADQPANVVTSDQWRNRLEFLTPDITGSNAITNTRLTLLRMASEPSLEGTMWLGIGKVARKSGLYQVAQHSLTQANICFCKSVMSASARESIGIVQLQLAKLKHDTGESMSALKLIEDGIPASIFLMDKNQLESYVARETASKSGEALARRILQATQWMAYDGLKSSLEIKDRYQTVLKLAPNWERGMFRVSALLLDLVQITIHPSLACSPRRSAIPLCQIS
ncbi:hypothetical protein ACHAWF_016768 [Thalassiosira exigua]